MSAVGDAEVLQGGEHRFTDDGVVVSGAGIHDQQHRAVAFCLHLWGSTIHGFAYQFSLMKALALRARCSSEGIMSRQMQVAAASSGSARPNASTVSQLS